MISGAVPGSLTTPAKADAIDDYMLEHMFGEPSEGFVGQAVNTLNQAAQLAGNIRGWVIQTNGELAAARQAFWTEYPNGSRLRERADQLSSLLFEKDLYYLMASLDDPHTRLIRMVGGDLDGGTPDSADKEFSEWQQIFTERLRVNGHLNSIFDFPVALTKAFMEAMPSFEPYKIARDWAEFQAAPIQIPTRQYVYMLVQRFPRPAPDDIARRDFDLLLKTFGEGRVLEVAKRVQDAPKKNGFLVNPADLGIFRARGVRGGREKAREDMIVVWDANDPYAVLWALLTKDDAKLYLLSLIFNDRKERASVLPATAAREKLLSLQSVLDEWNGLINRYGAGKVADAAEKVRKAPKTTSDGSLFIPKDLGVSAFRLYPAVKELLSGKPEVAAAPTPQPSQEPPKVRDSDNPDYLEWAKFGPGTELVYWSMSYTWKRDFSTGNRLIRNPHIVAEISTYTVSDVSDAAITINVNVARKYLDSNSEQPYFGFQQQIPAKVGKSEISNASVVTKFPFQSAMASGAASTGRNILKGSAKGTLQFNGRTLDCTLYVEHHTEPDLSDRYPDKNTTYWYCDLFPGKLVQRIEGANPGTPGELYYVATLRSAHIVPKKQTNGASPAAIDFRREITVESPELTGPNAPMVANPQSANGQTRLTDDGSAPPLLQVDDKEDQKHDPEFRFWSKFKPGTLINFITTHSVTTKDGQKITDKLSTRDSFRIESSDQEWIEISCKEATLNEGQWYGPPHQFAMGVGLNEFMNNSLYVSKRRAPWMSSMTGGAFRANTLPVTETGTETLRIDNQVLECRWFKTEKKPDQKESLNATYWVCDKVPGRFVRAIVSNDDNSSSETTIESINAEE
jgi:hypothetical protein